MAAPQALAVRPDAIPAVLKAMPHWLAWRWALLDGLLPVFQDNHDASLRLYLAEAAAHLRQTGMQRW